MRRLPTTILALFVVAALAACSSGATPGWTYAPAASTTPVPSGQASGTPSGGPSTAPTASGSAIASAPSSVASPAPSGAVPTLTVTAPVGAATAGFDPKTLVAPANTAFTIHFDNQDNQTPHNILLKKPDGSPVQIGGDTAFFTGPGVRDHQVPPLAAGDYTFYCAVHPTVMTGTLTAR